MFVKSTSTQLIEVLDRWTSFVDEGMPVDTLYLDFSKAFDTVPHQRLGVKLANYGVYGKLWQWIMSCLGATTRKRKQRVQYLSQTADWKDVDTGVPQGSVLGPVLFLIVINDLPEVVNGLINIIADETKLFDHVVDGDRCAQLQDDLDQLCVWSDTWKLKFNTEKCKVLHIGSNNHNYVYTMANNRDEKCWLQTKRKKTLV
jgi:ribonuclease P/MRP protein subunit RPP40